MKFIIRIVGLALSVVVFAVTITMWDLFVTNPCDSYNRSLDEFQKVEMNCK